MKRIISFGAYTFPDSIAERGEVLRWNFANGVPRTDRLPGMDGGYNPLGADAFPSEIGTVRYRFVLVADTPAEMTIKIDAVLAMARYGRATLTAETHGGDQRFCYGTVNNVSLSVDADVYSDKIVEVIIDWQVSDPRWYSTSADSPQVEACSGASTTFTVVNNGTASALAKISIDPGTAISASGVTVQRLVDSVAIDEVEYAAALLATDALVINAQTLTVTKNGSDAYLNDFSANHPAWFRLLPGDNTIKVVLGAAETADVTFEWDDCWY
ncbi:MAG: phage tail family protein [Anaerolineae bacterium]|nr:phage tail family protein [Anaerolineae bacterium]NUQ06725.1 phage tail family protein [Anaerolineae bacterium]